MSNFTTAQGLYEDLALYMIAELHKRYGGDWMLINRDEKPKEFRFTDGKRVMHVNPYQHTTLKDGVEFEEEL